MNKKILVTKGAGSGDTKLAAFDAALWSAGIANYNLVYLSSVIPPGYVPVIEKPVIKEDEYGNRLYLVIASNTAHEVGKQAWAGIGWVMTKSEPKRGLFVEHVGSSRKEVTTLIRKTLTNMTAYRKEKYGKIKYELSNIKCSGKPVCALVAAVYRSRGWG